MNRMGMPAAMDDKLLVVDDGRELLETSPIPCGLTARSDDVGIAAAFVVLRRPDGVPAL